MIFFLLVIIFGVVLSEKYDTEYYMKLVNSNSNIGWTAGETKFSSWTVDEIKSILNCNVDKHLEYREQQFFGSSLKEENQTFDAREKWPHCVHHVMDQGKCGSCWAFGVTESMSDRFCIASKEEKLKSMYLSPQDLVSCDIANFGCKGGNPLLAWEYVKFIGAVTDECLYYSSGFDGKRGLCPLSCHGKMKKWHEDKHKVKTFEHIKGNEEEIMYEIRTNGPVMSSFDVYGSFMSYRKGVYKKLDGEGKWGGHSIKIIGYGITDEDTPQKYWIVQNSWGARWGMSGYFWILRGVDECRIETQVYASTPKL